MLRINFQGSKIKIFKNMKILGIDPGTNRIGYAIITDKPLIAIDYGLIEIKAKDDRTIFLTIENTLTTLIIKHKPDLISVESLYFSNNQKTAFRVSEVRGLIKMLTFQNNIPLFEVNPKTMKLSMTGYGQSDKKSVAKMAKIIFKLDKPVIDDVTDALAIAYSALNYEMPL